MNETIGETTLRAIVAQVIGKETSGLALEDDLTVTLGIDSLAGLRVLAAVEKRSGVRFPDEQLGEFRSMKRVLEFTEGRNKEKEQS